MVLPRPHTRASLREAAGGSAPTAKQLPAHCADIPPAFPQGPKSIGPSRQARGKQHRFQSDWKARWILFPKKAPFRVHGEPPARIELRAFDNSLFLWFSLYSESIDYGEIYKVFGGLSEAAPFRNRLLSEIRISVPGKITPGKLRFRRRSVPLGAVVAVADHNHPHHRCFALLGFDWVVLRAGPVGTQRYKLSFTSRGRDRARARQRMSSDTRKSPVWDYGR